MNKENNDENLKETNTSEAVIEATETKNDAQETVVEEELVVQNNELVDENKQEISEKTEDKEENNGIELLEEVDFQENNEEKSVSQEETVVLSENDSISEEDISTIDKVKSGALWVALIMIILGFVALFYRFYPLTSKVNGNWKAETVNGNFRIENDGKLSTFIMEDVNSTAGMDMVFQSEFVPEAENEYFVKNTQVFLELNRENFDDSMVKQMVGDGTLLTEAMSTDTKIRLKYTKKGIEQTFGQDDINKMFKYVLRDFNWKLQGETLRLRNATFAEGGISFKKDK